MDECVTLNPRSYCEAYHTGGLPHEFIIIKNVTVAPPPPPPSLRGVSALAPKDLTALQEIVSDQTYRLR